MSVEMNGAASSLFPWPPVIYGSAVVLAASASWVSPWRYTPPDFRLAAIAAGIAITACGFGALLAAGRRFAANGTPVPPTRPTTAIVTTGIYRFTRNPMYLGMSLVLAGLGVAFDQVWFLLALPVAVLAVTKLAIEREETYLASKFGAAYVAYKSSVRRWF